MILKNLASAFHVLITVLTVTVCTAQQSRQPLPVGGWDKMQTAIQAQLPSRTNDVSGIVYVETTIDKEGKMTNISVVKGIGGYADEDVEKVVQRLDYPFVGAKAGGRAVNNKLIFPVYYNLSKEEIVEIKSRRSS